MAEIMDEKTGASTNVLTISRPSPTRQGSNQNINILSTIQDIDSTHSLTPPGSAHYEKAPSHTSHTSHPYSPFNFPENNTTESKQNINIGHSSFEQDIEAQALTKSKTEASGLSKNKCCKADPAWPGRDALKRKKRQMKMQRASCQWWVGLSKRNKIICKVLIILLIIGIATGIGLGISKYLGTGVWGKNGSNVPIVSK